MQELAKNVLILSKEENDSNEVAITCDLGTENPLEQFGISLGTEHEVDILADTLSNHIIVSQESVAVVVLHYLFWQNVVKQVCIIDRRCDIMGNTALNDMSYNFEPLKLFERNPNYKVDERELKESIEKSKELIARLQKKKQTVK